MKRYELIIKEKNRIIIIRKCNIEKLVHQPEYTYKGFSLTTSLFDMDTFNPTYTQPEEHYVIMTNGDKINLTEKQYKTIKKWF